MNAQDSLLVLLLQSMAGGATRNAFDVYKFLKERNWDVRLIVSNVGVATRYQEELNGFDKSDIEWVPMRRAPHVSDVSAYFRIRESLARIDKKTILHAHSTKAGMLGHLLRSHVYATVFSPHAYRGIDPKLHGPSRQVVERIESRYSSNYDRVVVEVPLEYDYAVKIGIEKQRLRLIPNGVNVTGAMLADAFDQRRVLPTHPTLGFVGRLVYQKNPLLFVEVLNQVVRNGCDAKAIIVGDGPLKHEMVELADRYGIAGRISWRGEVPAAAVYSEMDVMVHTSLYEAMAYSLIEACAALLPIVATQNPGSEAIIGNVLPDNLSAEGDARALARMVLRIVRDNQLRIEQLRIMERIAQQYSTENMISRLEDENRLLLFDRRPNKSAGPEVVTGVRCGS